MPEMSDKTIRELIEQFAEMDAKSGSKPAAEYLDNRVWWVTQASDYPVAVECSTQEKNDG